MERLTKRINDVVTYIGTENEYDTGMIAAETASSVAAVREILLRLAAHEDTGLGPEGCAQAAGANQLMEAFSLPMERIVELLKAEIAGRCVVLPCRQGDELWTYCNYPVKRVYSFTVSDVSTLNGRTVLNTLGLGTIRPEDIGKTVFLTRAEAERAMEGEKDVCP